MEDHTMVTRTEVVTTDDISGEPGAAPRKFGLDGTNYEIDLGDANWLRLDTALSEYIENARRVGKNGAPARRTGRKAKLATAVKPSFTPDIVIAEAVVEAKPRRGRAPMPVPADVLDVYRQAGTFGAVGDHFGVSTMTATKWVKAAQARR